MSLPLLVAVGLAILGVVLVFTFIRLERRDRGALAKRIGKAIGAPAPISLVAGKTKRSVAENRILAGLRVPFMIGMRRAWGVTLATPWMCLLALIGAGLAWLLLHDLLHAPIWAALPGAALLGLLMPRLLAMHQQNRAEKHFTELFPDTIDMIVRMVRAGLPVAIAIRAVGEQGTPPVSDIFVSIADRSEIGIPLEQALSDTGEELGLEDFRFFAVAVSLQRATGGNLARTLETFGEIIRKRHVVRMKAIAATAEVRMSAIILGAIPFFVVTALAFVNPEYLDPLLTDPRGNIVIGAALLSLAMGGLSMRWLIRSGTRV